MFCPSCGAEYADWAQRCPYCGTVNEKADEKLYLAHMEELRRRLDGVDEEAGRRYRSGIWQASKKTLVRLALAVAAAAAVSAAVFLVLRENTLRAGKAETERAEWEKEQYPELDRLYEAGDYEAIVRLDAESEMKCYTWDHYPFVYFCYYPWRTVESCRNVSTPALSTYDKQDLFYRAVSLYFFTEKENLDGYLAEGRMTAEEAEKALVCRESAREFFTGRLGLTEEETQKLCGECCVNGYPSIELCIAKADEYLGE